MSLEDLWIFTSDMEVITTIKDLVCSHFVVMKGELMEKCRENIPIGLNTKPEVLIKSSAGIPTLTTETEALKSWRT